MGDTHHHYHQTTSSKFGVRNAVGEIVEVQGGHIVRSTGRKDRHSKVCTAKGPRDRRVRLSAHTAIQFYDVQDRLGFDRPSKAVDWLIKKAKTAIDELAELPAWNPTTASAENETFEVKKQQIVADTVAGSSSSGKRCNIQNQHQQTHMSENESSFLPPTMDSDTIKSFFPIGASAESNSSVMQFQRFAPPDLLSRTSSQSQDLRLSLQSFQDPVLLHHQQSHQSSAHDHQTQQTLFSGPNQMGFDGSGWSEHQHGELGRFSRMLGWNGGGDTGGDGGGGFVFSSPPPTPPLLQPLFAQNQQFSQRGPLQSSNSPSVRAWIDPFSMAATDQHHHYQALPIHPSSISGIGFTSGGGFSGFRIPARIQGEEEEHDGVSDKPSSASSDSRH